nr:hypothetical protein [Burkholderia cepacia]
MSLHDATHKLSTRNERLQCASRAYRIDRLPPIETFEQERELSGRQRNNTGIGARPRETSFLEALRHLMGIRLPVPRPHEQTVRVERLRVTCKKKISSIVRVDALSSRTLAGRRACMRCA